MENVNLKHEKQCAIHDVRHSYLEEVKKDLVISEDIFAKCRKHSEKWKFYRDHIEWLESEIVSLS